VLLFVTHPAGSNLKTVLVIDFLEIDLYLLFGACYLEFYKFMDKNLLSQS